ncbi:MAG: carbamoyltransferase HypF [Planctomycetota bacterium]
MAVRRRVDVYGIVQGVGFRPTIFHMAGRRGLTGRIANTAKGVSIEVQGSAEAVEDFVRSLPDEAPHLARITALLVGEIACREGEETFRIAPSVDGEVRHALVLPDVAICEDCLRELFDERDRRHRYPFINCTNCGPRYTIVRDIPYDRPLTSMSPFPMCDACRREYEDPADRRFHAQATCCPDCGPRLDTPLGDIVERLKRGEIVAIKGIGGFHLAVDATSDAAVARLRERKRRVEKPFAVMVPDLERARAVCRLSEVEETFLLGVERPILLLERSEGSAVAEQVAPFNRDLGLFLPYTPLHHLLFDEGGFDALVMTSGNLSEEPIAIGNGEAKERLKEVADSFLCHDREILTRCDDAVVRFVDDIPRMLRLSRGFVPVPLILGDAVPPILAVGGELKNAVCLTKAEQAFVSQHVGFEEAIAHLQQLLGVEPEIVAHDLHPDYYSTKWAAQFPSLVAVQHHHAHVASCMAEHKLEERVIGIALDGTGYGTDGAIWGGEVLLADFEGFERFAHLQNVPLPGGDAAVREPWRMALSCLFAHFGREFLEWELPFVETLDPGKAELVLKMIEQGVNSPPTSSCGRLFDAVAALIGVRGEVNYEAQAAIELEMVTRGSANDEVAYPMRLRERVIETGPLFEAIVADIREGVPAPVLGRRFHNGLAEVLAEVARQAREQSELEVVCLSGGTFQNVLLTNALGARLEADGFEVFTHEKVPANDGGLCLGQALVAAYRANPLPDY